MEMHFVSSTDQGPACPGAGSGTGRESARTLSVECLIAALKPRAHTVSAGTLITTGQRKRPSPLLVLLTPSGVLRREDASCGRADVAERTREDCPRDLVEQGPQRMCAMCPFVPCGSPATSGLRPQGVGCSRDSLGAGEGRGESLGAPRTPVGAEGRLQKEP